MLRFRKLLLTLVVNLLSLLFTCCSIEVVEQNEALLCQDVPLLAKNKPYTLDSRIFRQNVLLDIKQSPPHFDISVPKTATPQARVSVRSIPPVDRVPDYVPSQSFYFSWSHHLCPWSYKSYINHTRIPSTLYSAQLSLSDATQVHQYRINGQNLVGRCKCEPIQTTISVLNFKGCQLGQEEWITDSVPVTAGYRCVSTKS